MAISISSRFSVVFVARLRFWLAIVACLTMLPLWASAEDPEFPLDFQSGMEATYQPDKAREAFQAYRQIGSDLEKRGEFPGAAIAYSNASSAARAIGRLQEALGLGQKAVEMAEHGSKPFDLAMILYRYGSVQITLGSESKAIAAFERALPYASQGRNPNAEILLYTGLTQAYRKTARLELALESAKKAVGASEATLQPGSTGRRRQWSPQAQHRQVSRERNYARALNDLGGTYLALRQWSDARPVFEKALTVGSRLQIPFLIATAHRGLAIVAMNMGEHSTAIRHLEDAGRANPQPVFAASIQGALGRLYRKMGRLAEAEEALRKAMAGIEDLRGLLESEELRESFFEDKIGAYEDLVLTLYQRGKVIDAFDTSERARARAFLDQMGNRVTLSRGQDEALIAEERGLREQISALKAASDESPAQRQGLEVARVAYQNFLRRLQQTDREQASLMSVEPLTLPQLQELLPEGTLLLEYFVTDQGMTILWSVEHDRVAVTSLPLDRRRVRERVQAFRRVIAARDEQPEMRRMAQRLYDELLRPGLQGRMPKELVIVPHDVLHYLPFQALMSGPDRYLIQDTPLSYYSSASLMQFTRAKGHAQSSSTLAFGNPDLQNPALNLRYAEREVRVVADLFPGSVVFTRKDATKAKYRDEGSHSDLLHFATHAELDEADPLGSALLLAPANGDNGRLEAQEVFGLALKANLVVLSACETGLDKLTSGDELTGLTRAFIYAGTPSIITTLWQVNDRASYELMQEFYRNLKAGRGKAEALRDAQIATLAKYPHPYYWAAYQLTGEAR
jgi:CHAT domain-containing protein